MKKNVFKKILYSTLVAVTVITTVPTTTLSVDAANKPKVSSFQEINTGTSDKIKIKLKASTTKSYKVWISTKKKSGFKKVSYKKSYNKKVNTLTIKKCGSAKIKANKTYYVKVTVYAKKNYKGKKVTKTYKVYSAPDVTKQISYGSVKTTSVKLSWKKVSGATRYQVKLNGKTYTQKGTSRTMKNLVANTKYKAYVRSYKQVNVNGKKVKLYSKWKSFTFYTAPTTTSSISISDVTTTSSQISWMNVNGASKYQLKVNNKTYTVGGTSKEVSGLISDTTYTASVRAYKQVKINGTSTNIYGSWKSTTFTTEETTSSSASSGSSDSSSDSSSSSSNEATEDTTDITTSVYAVSTSSYYSDWVGVGNTTTSNVTVTADVTICFSLVAVTLEVVGLPTPIQSL